ncbi:hypothetical protein GF378_02140 [Candidatus Pacearchaeota archaeon]|nr:hypothetical protein [Candidatus Pacearchaeota archaeon]
MKKRKRGWGLVSMGFLLFAVIFSSISAEKPTNLYAILAYVLIGIIALFIILLGLFPRLIK